MFALDEASLFPGPSLCTKKAGDIQDPMDLREDKHEEGESEVENIGYHRLT